MVRRRRLLPAVTVALAVLGVLLPAPVRSHGGNRVVEVVAGPYIISAFVSHAGDQIDETVGVIDDASKEVVKHATVTLSLERGEERRGPFLTRPLDGSYEARYPAPDGDGWTVLVEVQGPQGSAAVRHPYRAPGGDGIGGRLGLLLNFTVLALLLAAVFVLPRWGRTRRAGPGPARAP